MTVCVTLLSGRGDGIPSGTVAKLHRLALLGVGVLLPMLILVTGG